VISKTKKFNQGALRKRKTPVAMSATRSGLRILQVDIPDEMHDWLEDVACYEERTKSTVARSMLWLGRRVYKHLTIGTDAISPYAPACIDISDNEIEEVAQEVIRDAKAVKIGRRWHIKDAEEPVA
jgi:hypothetical protein